MKASLKIKANKEERADFEDEGEIPGARGVIKADPRHPGPKASPSMFYDYDWDKLRLNSLKTMGLQERKYSEEPLEPDSEELLEVH